MVRVAPRSGGLRRRLLVPTIGALLALAVTACGGDRPLTAAGPEDRPAPPTTVVSSATPGAPVGDVSTSGSTPPGDGSGFVPEPVSWRPCGNLECATVTVPLDHGEPAGPTVDIALNRVPASGERRGAIFVNPGGPGASGIEFVAGGFRLDPATMAAYDLVGFDPRGVGDSAPVSCDLDRSAGPQPDHSPDDAEEARVLDEAARQFAATCGVDDDGILAHLDTVTVARDLDLLRQAVGDEDLHYLGFSFGTLIGLLYAETFPGRVGHIVLDAVVDPGQDLVDLLTQQAIAFEAAFDVLDQACDRDLDCPPGGAAAAHDELSRRLESEGAVGEVGPTELDNAALLTLYDRELWPLYAMGLSDALDGDFGLIEALSDALAGAVPFGAYAAVSCTDSPRPDSARAWDQFVGELSVTAPRFGAAVGNELRVCAHWPVAAGPDRPPVRAEGAGPILVIGNTNDPATPLANAEAVVAALAESALIVAEIDGHTAYAASPCVQDLVASYFLDGAVPPSPTRC